MILIINIVIINGKTVIFIVENSIELTSIEFFTYAPLNDYI